MYIFKELKKRIFKKKALKEIDTMNEMSHTDEARETEIEIERTKQTTGPLLK